MNLSFYIARRYLFSRKKHNAVNIISGISVCGVALATLAMVCTLSVFNGFQDMVAGFFTAFDPQLKITVREGKVFLPDEPAFRQVRALPEVEVWTETLEENAMVQYKDRQVMAVIKGVEDNFEQLTSIDYRFMHRVAMYGLIWPILLQLLIVNTCFRPVLCLWSIRRNTTLTILSPRWILLAVSLVTGARSLLLS